MIKALITAFIQPEDSSPEYQTALLAVNADGIWEGEDGDTLRNDESIQVLEIMSEEE